jgi:hypothetical protein
MSRVNEHVVYIIANYDTNQAYTGLTKRFQRRMSDHRRRKPHLFTGRHVIIKTGPISAETAQRFEGDSVRFLQLVGFKLVNEAKPGSLGALEEAIWTKERCAEEAARFATRGEFQRGSCAYQAALRNGWLDDIYRRTTPRNYWTKERCADEASKYKTRREFERQSRNAYNAAQRNGWLNDVCAHMTLAIKPKGYWTKEHCADEAKRHTHRTEFLRNAAGAYEAAKRNGWLDDVCAHMTDQRKCPANVPVHNAG